MGIGRDLIADFVPSAYDAIVVGAGFAGAVCARSLAERANMRVAVLERRGNVAGNAYDQVDSAGILVHQYGPHIYHTNDERVHQFLSRFATFNDYQYRVLADVHGLRMPVPFNKRSLLLAFGQEEGKRLYKKLVRTFGKHKAVTLMSLRKKNDEDLVRIADYVYENIYRQYTIKQWGVLPEQVDEEIIGRVPIWVGKDDRYFPWATYQGVPTQGYTALFARMLDHDLISVFLGVDARDVLRVEDGRLRVCDEPYGGEVVYTGALDEFFSMDLGPLPYRTVEMEFLTFEVDQYQPVGTIHYTVDEEYTRVSEFKHMTGQELAGKTTIVREYPKPYVPGSGQTPCYVMHSSESVRLYKQYYERVENVLNFHVVGRLAEYRYYDMDGAVASALALSDEIIEQR